MKSKLFNNLRLQTYLQIVNTIIPLITTPYIARVLGADNIGVYSSTHSIASFFILFALMGTSSYGTRCLSTENDIEKRRKVFIEIYIMQLITSFIATSCYFFYCVFFADNKLIAYLQFITLAGCFIDVSWFFFGMEDFKIPVLSSMFFRLVSVILLFSFVRDSGDLWIYSIIMLSSAFMSQVVLWLIVLKNGYLRRVRIYKDDIKKHILPNLKLFIPIFAMTVYNSTDKAMLGKLSTYDQAGYYANIDRIINVPFSIFSGIGTVFLPRMTVLCSEEPEKAKVFFFNTLSGIVMLGVAISCGLIAVSDSFIPFFLGSGYNACIVLIKFFSPVIIIKCISNAIRLHFLVPFKMENIYIKATCGGALLNFSLNIFLIPKYGALGAIITTFVSETVGLAIELFLTYKLADLKVVARDTFFYLIAGLVMIGVLQIIDFNFLWIGFNILLEVVIGALIYIVLIFCYWIISHNAFYEMYVRELLNSLKTNNGNEI